MKNIEEKVINYAVDNDFRYELSEIVFIPSKKELHIRSNVSTDLGRGKFVFDNPGKFTNSQKMLAMKILKKEFKKYSIKDLSFVKLSIRDNKIYLLKGVL